MQESVTGPVKPPPGESCKEYCAGWPAATLAVVEPEGAADSRNADAKLPVTEIDCGEFVASSVMTSEPDRWPCAAGVKFTVTAQPPCAGTEIPTQLFVCEKSPGFEPLATIPETCNALVPEFTI